MSLVAGARVGPYEIHSLLGRGGMGEVYRARDGRLNRDVAVKVVGPAVAHEADRLVRFAREAQVLAALNHPNIAQLHGLEEAEGHPALVMELVEGPTLADRLAAGALPLDEALPVARQIVEALEAAHASGIVHRDLKPANIKVRDDGTVKVLDFGLAKAFDQNVSAIPGATTSPTISMHATAAGIILGTAAYMSPEQARGRPVDKRADIWAFGAVLFEMVTGRRAFDADDTSDTLALVLTKDPDWTALPPSTPPAIRRLIRRCLERDPKRRVPDIAVARLEIDEAMATGAGDSGVSVTSDVSAWRSTWRWVRAFGAGVALAGAIAALAIWSLVRPAPASSPVARFGIALPPEQQLAVSVNDRDLALSPDGTLLVYTAGAQAQLMVRPLDRLEPLPLAGITSARAPFVSPDGRWVGFFDRLDEAQNVGTVVQPGALKRVSMRGGQPMVVASLTGASRGASWGTDQAIVFATSDPSTGLLRVPADGGATEVLTAPDATAGESDHWFPSVLPDARGVLFTIVGRGSADRRVAVLDLQTRERRTLIRSGSQAEYLESGHLVYVDGGSLWAVRFDAARLKVIGEPVPLVNQVLTLGAAGFSVSRRGSLVYVPTQSGKLRSLVWVDRQGTEEPISAPPRAYVRARLSPDATRIAVQIFEQAHQIWTFDLAHATSMRLTFGQFGSYGPVWTRDGQYIMFGRGREGSRVSTLSRRKANGTGADEELTTDALGFQRLNAVAPDGTSVVFEELTAEAGYDLRLLVLEGALRAEALLSTPFDERDAVISPDGRWMAYESNDSGQSQIYVRPFPDVNATLYQISTAGGRTPVWAPTGRELYFINGFSVMAVPMELTPAFRAGSPTKLFDGHGLVLDGRFVGGGTIRTYDVSPVGGRFLMIKDNAALGEDGMLPASMVVVQNWNQELKQRVPAR